MHSKSILARFSAASSALCLLMVLPLPAGTFENFTYDDNGTSITITDYQSDAGGAVIIPATIADKPVTSIGEEAFWQCTSLTRITIPGSVTSIGESAFEFCDSLRSVTLPSSVTSIGEFAFYNCRGLTSVTMGNAVTRIGRGAFANCYGLTQLSIPSSVTRIGHYAFSACYGLTRVTIPIRVADIGKGAFAGCIGLTAITVDPANPNFSSLSGVLFNKTQNILIQYPAGMGGSYLIPSGVIRIEESAFFDCDDLTRVTIPSSVTNIMNRAFYGCRELTTATFSGNAPIMGTAVFENAASNFKVEYIYTNTGFTSPTWLGYSCFAATAPEIDVQQPANTSLVDGTSKRSFGTVKVGAAGVRKSYVIRNLGTSDLTILKITTTGANPKDFIHTPLNDVTVKPGATLQFNVVFAPTATGPRTGAIHIASNDENENAFDIQLMGMGVSP